jgi:hypothetical protein
LLTCVGKSWAIARSLRTSLDSFVMTCSLADRIHQSLPTADQSCSANSPERPSPTGVKVAGERSCSITLLKKRKAGRFQNGSSNE